MTTNPPKQNKTQSKSVQKLNKDVSFKWLIILLAIVAACLNGLYFINFNGGWGNQADFGAFGDFLGGVLNPILGFVTVGLLIWSLKMQLEELSLSRNELALTRQELAETKEEASLSRRAMEAQVNHIENEAKLSEITRLLERSQTKYETLMSMQFPLTQFHTSPSSIRMIKDSYRSLLNHTILDMDEHTALALMTASTKNSEISAHFNLVRREVILFTDLALKYYSINNSTEFARAYLFDALDILTVVSRIAPNDITQNRIEEIADILANISDIIARVTQPEVS
ncbi:hypothetical protein [Shewanella sp. MBTL60-007]|uniref:hypothetical protein n=1 Tax=Shewanella sp. MBTL60-007 TaxID=2815911 RepID=UPI001BB9475F|nr:hypothetical protein [Shewanella sp. MBTL60-007]GIU26216.1 hypothetical protein TUM3792_32740 [Shewanella sp. MBTL60-007]